MPQDEDTQIVVELTHHSLHVLRARKGTIEAGGECVLANKAGIEALLGAVTPDWKASGLRADAYIWPDTAGWRLSTDTEAMLDRTDEALSTIAAADLGSPGSEFAFAACGAGDGGTVTPDGIDKWVMAYSPGTSLERVSEELSNLKIESDGAGPAAFAHIMAISASLKAAGSGAVALVDLGSERSSIILITANGVEGTVPCAIGIESIFGAVQTALRLKFRGAGERLFFNEAYDFTEPGPKVAAIIGPVVKEALGLLPKLGSPPALACLGLTGKQSWFIRDVSVVAGVPVWEADLGKLAGELGLKFADDAAQAAFTATSAGVLGLLGAKVRASQSWTPAWAEAQAPEEALEPEPEPEPVAEPEPEPAPVEPVARPVAAPPRTRPTLSVEPGSTQAPPPSKPSRPPSAPGPKPAVPAVAPKVSFSSPVARPPAPTASPFQAEAPASSPFPSPTASFPAPASSFPAPASPSFPAPPAAAPPSQFSPPPATPRPPPVAPPQFGAPPAGQKPPSFSNPGFVLPEPGGTTPPQAGTTPAVPPPSASPFKTAPAGGTTPPQAVTALPFEGGKIKPAAPAAEKPQPPKSRTGFYVTIGVVAAVVFAAIMFVLDERRQKANAEYLAQQEELAHHVAEERLKEAEKAQADDAAKAQRAMEIAVEITKKQAEEETRKRVLAEMEADRLAKLPGTIIVATSPTGASVSIDGAAPIPSPVKLDGVAPGEHRVQITLAGHASASLTATVEGSKTVDLGTVTLESILGALTVSSTPDNLEFAVRPASDPTGKPVRSGRAPASFPDLPFGDYLVTFSRPECRDHVEKVTVVKGGTSPVTTAYQDGSLELSSEPSGAWVNKDGSQLGTTPLELHDLTPKKALFELTLPGYDPTPVTCDIPEGDTLKLSVQLLRKDRVFNPDEVKTAPVAYVSPQPKLTDSQRKLGAQVTISLVVGNDGTIRDVEIEKASDDDIARRCKAAVEGWKFRPATAPDDRPVDAKIEVPFSFPSANQ